MSFALMAFATFVYDTLDVCTRLGRYILQELFGWKGRAGALAATAMMCLLPFGLLMASGPGSYRWFWTLFGTSNQLLAGLSLIVVSVWLKGTNRRYWYTLIPAVFVLGITLWSLVSQMLLGFTAGASRIALINAVVAIALLGLAFLLMAHGARALFRRGGASQAAPAVSALPPG